ncbi:hypothetical protein BT93_H0292 [Corymbia citriodora subsp. variegata]|nr:hypothetical protein BT93_H0292 [Corymbia citriodora subsp. variegata]
MIDFIDNHQFIDLIIGEHSYDSTIEEKCNANDLLGIVNNIISGASLLVDKGSGNKVPIDVSQTGITRNISHLINWICCQMTCEAARGKNVNHMLREIFLKLSSYRWTTQVLLVLAAFALQYGEFWYISEAPSDGRNAPLTYLLKGLSSFKKRLLSDEKKTAAMIPLNKVVNELLELTTSLVDLDKLVVKHRGKHVPKLAEAFRTIPKWSCEAIIAILATGNYFGGLIDDDKSAESELNTLMLSVSDRKDAVLTAIKACKKKIGRTEDYRNHVKMVEASVDIVDFLNSLLIGKDPLQDPIVTGPNNTPVKFESLRNKTVLLIISDLKISMDDINTLEIIHDDPKRVRRSPSEHDLKDDNISIQIAKETLYELVWIPIVDATPENLEALLNLKSLMPWAFVVDPQKMNKLAPTYIKEEWRFKRETIVVVLDSLGWVENTDAMPMLRTWETGAFPYTGNESTHPWRDRYNWVELVLKEPVVSRETVDKIRRTEYTLFYGGTPAVNTTVATGAIPNLGVVHIENTKCFFISLRSCLICRLQALQILKPKMEPLTDTILYELCEAYKAYQGGGFAMLIKGHDLSMLHVGPFDTTWKQITDLPTHAEKMDLAEAFKKKNNEVQERPACVHVYIPDYPGLGDLRCPFCRQSMGYDLSFKCCHSGSK